MRSLRSVTMTPIGMPVRSLKAAIDFLARVITGFWPTIAVTSLTASSSALAFCDRLAHADVEHDLAEARHLHGVLITKLFHQRGYHFLMVLLPLTRFELCHSLSSRRLGVPSGLCLEKGSAGVT